MSDHRSTRPSSRHGASTPPIDRGVNCFNTANMYSEGEAERILGAGLKHPGIARKNVVVATVSSESAT